MDTFNAKLSIYIDGDFYKEKNYILYGLYVKDFTFLKDDTLKLNKSALLDLFDNYFDNVNITECINKRYYILKLFK